MIPGRSQGLSRGRVMRREAPPVPDGGGVRVSPRCCPGRGPHIPGRRRRWFMGSGMFVNLGTDPRGVKRPEMAAACRRGRGHRRDVHSIPWPSRRPKHHEGCETIPGRVLFFTSQGEMNIARPCQCADMRRKVARFVPGPIENREGFFARSCGERCDHRRSQVSFRPPLESTRDYPVRSTPRGRSYLFRPPRFVDPFRASVGPELCRHVRAPSVRGLGQRRGRPKTSVPRWRRGS